MKRVLLTQWVWVTCLAGLLAGCATTSDEQQQQLLQPGSAPQVSQIEGSLNQAAARASQSLAQLAAIKKAQHPVSPMPFGNITDPALNKVITLNNYYGPIESITKLVADQVGFQLQVYGKPPATPILVDLENHVSNATALEMLRNIDLQSGMAASLVIIPQYKIISLRYM